MSETLEFLGGNVRRTVAVATILACLGFAFHWWWSGREAVVAELEMFVLYGLAPVVVASILIFLCMWIFASGRIYCEQSARIAELENQLTRRSPLLIEFPVEANYDNKVSPYRISRRFLTQDGGPPLGIVRDDFYCAIQNVSDKTVRNVRLLVLRSNKPDHFPMSHVPTKDGSADRCDIQPHTEEYFHLAFGFHNDRPAAAPYVVERSKALEIRGPEYIKGGVPSCTGPPSVLFLANDGYIIEVQASADDVPPVKEIFVFNGAGKISLWLGAPPADGSTSEQSGQPNQTEGALA